MPIVSSLAGASALGFGIFASGAMESIATVTVGAGGASSINFTSIPATYQHLQVRWLWRSAVAGNGDFWSMIRLNGDTTTSNYARHTLYGTGAAAAAESGVNNSYTSYISLGPANGRTANVFSGVVVDVLDYGNTSKNTTVRAFGGYDANGAGLVVLGSVLWRNTAAVTSLELAPAYDLFTQYSTAALYGIKAP